VNFFFLSTTKFNLDDKIMVKITTLEIPGFNDQPVPNTYYQQKDATPHLAIVLPGFGYTAKMPLLYYSTRLMLQIGTDVLSIDYAYNKMPEYKHCSEDEKTRWLMADVLAACNAGLGEGEYGKITLVGKSLGTIAIANLLASNETYSTARAVWLTPVLDMQLVRQGILDSLPRSFLAIGTNDPFYDATFIDQLKLDAPDQVMVVDHADHGLEIKDDLQQSLIELESLMQALLTFFSKEL